MNRYGLGAVAFRAGTHATFKQAMLDALGAATGGALRTRDGDDFAVALLDAWAVAADVLTFYDERLINEFFLRTATDPASVAALARLVGYRPRPGLAASAFLAYTVDDPPRRLDGLAAARGRAAGTVPIPAGAQVQNTPTPGTLPQTFETTAPLDARASASALTPRLTLPYPPLMQYESARRGTASRTGAKADQPHAQAAVETAAPPLYVRGPAAVAGDVVMLRDGYGDRSFATVRQVSARPDGTTALTFVNSIPDGRDPGIPDPNLTAASSAPALPLTSDVPGWVLYGFRWEQRDLAETARGNGWPLEDFGELVDRDLALQPLGIEAWVCREAGGIFGRNAPLYASLADPMKSAWAPGWVEPLTLGTDPALGDYGYPYMIDLDGVASWIVPGRTVLIASGGDTVVATVLGRQEVSRSGYGLSARVTRLTLDWTTYDAHRLGAFDLRSTSVTVADRPLALAPVPVTAPVRGTSILLERCVLFVGAGQPLALSGERVDRPGVRDTEIVVPADVTIDDGRTRLSLGGAGLAHAYVPATVTLNANVVAASNGQTRSEAIGSGDASVPFQRFRLAHRPLTWVSAAVPGGIDAALSVRVNGVEWTRVDRFYGRGPRERIYTVEYDDAGYAYVRTGDGITGARVPTGTENVSAVYREGLGAAGLLDAHRLTLLITRPPGVKSVDNPVATSGAADPETIDDARANAAIGLRALERIVSLEDYVDFVRASGGIAKADAMLVTRGTRRTVVVTVAGPDGTPVVAGSPQATDLAAAVEAASGGRATLELVPYRPVSFRLAASVARDPAYDRDALFAAVDATLRARFGFGARSFGAPVAVADISAAIHTVPGVVAVAVTQLYRTGAWPGPHPSDVRAAPAALLPDGTAVGAELLTLDPGPLQLGELA